MNVQMLARKRAKKRWGWMVLALLVVVVLAAQPVMAQTYRFQVTQASADLYINEDGTASIDYNYVFQNSPSADPIDVVYIGIPTDNYDIGSITAQINGQSVAGIEPSPYVKPGVAIDLGRNAIQPGQSGTLSVHIGTVRGMLFKANTQESEPYASFQYTPNYFGSEFVNGTTNLTVTLHLPPGLTSEEPRYFPPKSGWPGSDQPDETGIDDAGRVYYRWSATNANISNNYIFGAAFPARVVPESVLLTEVPFRINAGAILPVLFCLGFGVFLVFTVWAGIASDRKRRLQYLPPRISVEGNGIKRGLTAVEAAIVMQQPMDKILTMILFSVLKKGAATVVSRTPMKVQPTSPQPEDLRPYEVEFVHAMEADQSSVQRDRLQTLMTNLVQSVSEKMRGFSRKETLDYYQDIMQKAWQQVESADTPEVKMKTFDEAMDWTMLDRRFDDRTREVFGPRPVIVPMWWWRFDPGMRGSVGPSAGAGRPSVSTSQNMPPQGVNLPSLPGGDFAASMVGGMQAFATNVVGDLTSFTGGVTQKTNPVPKSSSGGGRSGGGGRTFVRMRVRLRGMCLRLCGRRALA